jgi:hypothetical protein
MWGLDLVSASLLTRTLLEWRTAEGDSPVGEKKEVVSRVSRVLLVGYPAGMREPVTPNPKYTPRPIAH